ncbi:hypothetical protein PHYBLDRAFT_174795 [Phycomyces blakesleeanus NRRL 1555(-)]|uniref:Uncharacterized protein n=1 Tax=Phycomyces blakesleeanus (strain ATCC 8743b / DSM 1359 / FGSC 10004 / NBRC 33097 / NRRL 1555) TaxID=763407 RepID=A0A162N8D2_PHYB8|nr:hypothetical protein PHYBLDRAFT_174795 [Phycomyces blakesleeanus NRRL 1555(-)]OAD66764.1 hypothetical protein PHYBLDRAFT_174795 [Phycomyces blakesleeanus NRRL 1555(-)]|eukprot:XP_018284804.1 hypothetical protein PHYBLDRAFT_174795 [Phycomyces blakesleeanus NRRL 1555(-)]
MGNPWRASRAPAALRIRSEPVQDQNLDTETSTSISVSELTEFSLENETITEVLKAVMEEGIKETSSDEKVTEREEEHNELYLLGAKIDIFVDNNINVAYNFRIHRTIFYRTGFILPVRESDIAHPKFAQIYIYNSAAQIDQRQYHSLQLERSVLKKIWSILMETNPFIHLFRTIDQISWEKRQFMDLTLRLVAEGPWDQRQYNAPTAKIMKRVLQETLCCTPEPTSDKTSMSSTDLTMLYTMCYSFHMVKMVRLLMPAHCQESMLQ